MKINSPHFGEIELEVNDSTFVPADVSLNDRTTYNAHLFIDQEISENSNLHAKVEAVLQKLDSLDHLSRKILMNALEQNNSTVIDYIDFHLKEVPEMAPEILEVFSKRIGVDTISRHLLLKHLEWRAIGLHEEDGRLVFVMDYMASSGITDEILCVKYDENGDFVHIAHES